MRLITSLHANDDWTLDVVFSDGAARRFDLKPLLGCEAFSALKSIGLFKSVRNGGYFVEWDNDADLSADTLYLEGVDLPTCSCAENQEKYSVGDTSE